MKAKNLENAQVENVEMANVENMNVEATENAQVENVENGDMLTEDEKAENETALKAGAILRLRMPNLTKHALSFEKRTGNFFRATLVKQVDKNGEPIWDGNGNQVEKIQRLVVDLQNEDGTPTVEAVECEEEIKIKRAAGLVLTQDTKREKYAKEVEELEKKLAEAREALEGFNGEVQEATAIVDAYELPEKEAREAKERLSKKELEEKAAAIEEQNKKLRAMLIAAGIDPNNME